MNITCIKNQVTIGIVGMGAMGKNLAYNFASKGITVGVTNRTLSILDEVENVTNLSKSNSVDELISSISAREGFKYLILLVKAGSAVDAMLEVIYAGGGNKDLKVIDMGNSNPKDSQVRLSKYPNLVVCGISGGEEGARYGASYMMSGNVDDNLKNILSEVSALDFLGGETVGVFGLGNEGNIVKTIHNGIEYSQMQLIGEIINTIKIGKIEVDGYKNDNQSISKLLTEMASKNNDFLLSIFAKTLLYTNIENVTNYIGAKGTGGWSIETALEVNKPFVYMSYSLNRRILSSQNIEVSSSINISTKRLSFDEINELYNFCCCEFLREGVEIIESKIKDISDVLRVWQGGCIIRSNNLLKSINTLKDNYHNLNDNLYNNLSLLPIGRTVQEVVMIYKSNKNMVGSNKYVAVARDVFGAHGFNEYVSNNGEKNVEVRHIKINSN